jgi:hypothetical protein
MALAFEASVQRPGLTIPVLHKLEHPLMSGE